MMRKLPLLSIALFLFTGCSDVTFENPMPLDRRDMSQFPKKWQGEWTDGEHTYVIGHRFFYEKESSPDPIQLDESVRLRRFQGYLVLNQKQDNGEWQVLLAKRKKQQIQLFEFDASDEEKVAIWQSILASEIREESSGDLRKKSYTLSPENNTAFRQLILKGGLTLTGTLELVAPSQLESIGG